MAEAVWISEQNVVDLMSLPEAIEALEQGLTLEAKGEAQNMVKTHVAWGHNNLHAVGAAYPAAGFIGTKTWAHTSGGACPLLILFDAESGQLKAVIEAFALGQMRTGGISGVATRWLADERADVLALIGTGKQALTQVAAVHAVRPLKQVRVFSPRAESRRTFIEKARGRLDIEFMETTSVETALADAPIITTVTRATQAFVHSANVARGAHINAIGAITGEREELAQDVFARCSLAAVDDPAAAKRLSSELIQAFGKNDEWPSVTPLSALVAARRGREAGDDITVFKAMGMGVSDLALGIELYRHARSRAIGKTISNPQRSVPRLTR